MSASVNAIIPTLAERRRWDALRRAIASLRASTAAVDRVEIIVVVNGARWDPEVVSWLETQPVRLVRVAEGSAPLAQLVGRQHVTAPCFCFLDDDDEYLPGAIDIRCEVLERDPAVDLVVTNGWRCSGAREAPVFQRLESVERDPLSALFDENWLASCGALFRTDRVGVEFFENYHPYLEWTWLAFRLASAGRRVAAVDVPTFRIHDTPGSASKSSSYAESERALYERMLSLATRDDVCSLLRDRIQNQWSMRSIEKLGRGDVRGAWVDYRRVLAYPGAWRYGSQFVRLVIGSMRSRRGGAQGGDGP
jgi:glycosyltransferase involved in cell wall biosynthesis